jgi:hypothetical protein
MGTIPFFINQYPLRSCRAVKHENEIEGPGPQRLFHLRGSLGCVFDEDSYLEI